MAGNYRITSWVFPKGQARTPDEKEAFIKAMGPIQYLSIPAFLGVAGGTWSGQYNTGGWLMSSVMEIDNWSFLGIEFPEEMTIQESAYFCTSGLRDSTFYFRVTHKIDSRFAQEGGVGVPFLGCIFCSQNEKGIKMRRRIVEGRGFPVGFYYTTEHARAVRDADYQYTQPVAAARDKEIVFAYTSFDFELRGGWLLDFRESPCGNGVPGCVIRRPFLQRKIVGEVRKRFYSDQRQGFQSHFPGGSELAAVFEAVDDGAYGPVVQSSCNTATCIPQSGGDIEWIEAVIRVVGHCGGLKACGDITPPDSTKLPSVIRYIAGTDDVLRADQLCEALTGGGCDDKNPLAQQQMRTTEAERAAELVAPLERPGQAVVSPGRTRGAPAPVGTTQSNPPAPPPTQNSSERTTWLNDAQRRQFRTGSRGTNTTLALDDAVGLFCRKRVSMDSARLVNGPRVPGTKTTFKSDSAFTACMKAVEQNARRGALPP
jgi:hypothetical protein